MYCQGYEVGGGFSLPNVAREVWRSITLGIKSKGKTKLDIGVLVKRA